MAKHTKLPVPQRRDNQITTLLEILRIQKETHTSTCIYVFTHRQRSGGIARAAPDCKKTAQPRTPHLLEILPDGNWPSLLPPSRKPQLNSLSAASVAWGPSPAKLMRFFFLFYVKWHFKLPVWVTATLRDIRCPPPRPPSPFMTPNVVHLKKKKQKTHTHTRWAFNTPFCYHRCTFRTPTITSLPDLKYYVTMNPRLICNCN